MFLVATLGGCRMCTIFKRAPESVYATVGQILQFSTNSKQCLVAHRVGFSPDKSVVILRTGDILALTLPAAIQNCFRSLLSGLEEALFVKKHGGSITICHDYLVFPNHPVLGEVSLTSFADDFGKERVVATVTRLSGQTLC